MAAAIGAGLPITQPAGSMIVDIGGGTTDIAVITLASIVYSKAVRVAGNEMDEAIVPYIKKTYNLLIGERTAEADQDGAQLGVSARRADDDGNQGPASDRGHAEDNHHYRQRDSRSARGTVNVIVDAVRVALERTPPELSADIVDRGIVITGGGSLLQQSRQAPARGAGLPVSSAEIRCRRSCSAPARCSASSICCGRSRSTDGPCSRKTGKPAGQRRRPRPRSAPMASRISDNGRAWCSAAPSCFTSA